jgi:hypothetical protein
MLALVLSSGGATLVRDDGPIVTTLQGVANRIPLDYPQEMSEIISAQPTVLVDRGGETCRDGYLELIEAGWKVGHQRVGG